MSRILLLLDHAANRHLLAEALGTRHETLAPGSEDALDLPFDLCVMDGPALDRLWARVRARRTAVQPQFLPFLLVVSRHDVGMATRHLWRTVDELIFSPIEKVELQARVENLLNARRLSAELERHVAERTAALRASEARLRAILDAEPECVMLLAADGSLLDMNPAGLRLFAADSSGPLAGQGVEPLVAAEQRAAFRRLVETVFQGQSGALEYEIINLKGERRWLESHATPLRDPDGIIQAALVVTRDVTERKQAEAALLESEERFAAAFRSNPAGVVITTLEEGRFLDVNEAFLRIFGLAREQVIGRTSAELGLVDSPETHREAAMKVRQSGAFRDCEMPFRRPDGSPGYLHCSGERLVLNGQECLLTLLLDITDRRRAEERLRRLNRTYEVLSQINELIVRERDPQTLLERACRIAVDKGGFRMAWIGLRAPPSGPLKLAAHAGATHDTVAVLEQLLGDPPHGCAFTDRALATGRPAVCNDIASDPLAAAWRAAALERGCRSMVALPLVSAGQTVGTFNLYAALEEFFDPEEQRLLEELAADIGFAPEVSRREAERRRLEEQLRHAQKMEAIGQLAGGVAHDFNNILAAILMQTELLGMRSDLPPHVPEGLQQIQAAVERAAHLTRQLLTFSRKQVLQPRNLDLNLAITDLVKMLRRIIGEDIRLEVRLHPAPLRLHADAGMLDQVLMNLAVNARDAMPRGGQLVIESFARELGPAEAATRPAARWRGRRRAARRPCCWWKTTRPCGRCRGWCSSTTVTRSWKRPPRPRRWRGGSSTPTASGCWSRTLSCPKDSTGGTWPPGCASAAPTCRCCSPAATVRNWPARVWSWNAGNDFSKNPPRRTTCSGPCGSAWTRPEPWGRGGGLFLPPWRRASCRRREPAERWSAA